ncbi:MAG: hydrogenase maturation peptidase HycI [Bacillota bacterium]|nr:hydrogenase maturation peptidase HycI [Bacillota bacterium]
MKGLVITVGNSLMGDDGAGPLLARLLASSPLPDWEVINGRSAPENCIHLVRRMKPELAVVVDAAEMGLAPGSIRLLSEDYIAEQFIFTTHNLPLTFFLLALKEIVPRVYFVGIQPKVVAFGCPLSREVREAAEAVYQQLKSGSPTFPEL